jgi:hypothetical protein
VKRLHFACLFLVLVSTMTLAKSAPVPLVYQPLVPTSVAPGSGGFTLTINGTGFASDAVVNWNGSPRVTSVISSSQVQAIINAEDVANAGTASVTVTNPEKINRTSNVVFFSVRHKSSKVAFSLDPHLIASGPIAVGDFNNDGKLDVAIGNGSVVDVYLGKGDGTLRKPIESSVNIPPSFMVAADFNNDGKLDLLVSGGDNGVYVTTLLGDGTGKLTNKGKTSLSISQIAITGKDAADFKQTNNCGSSVPAGGSCKISVTFDPTAKGNRSAAVSISDDGGASPQRVSLAGTGT